ncbi:MAG: hypothetical protein KJO31_17360 [Gammaproteobacteria bacterium]|nr:hypothetical protein [Gammaproteobacteria bacterium]
MSRSISSLLLGTVLLTSACASAPSDRLLSASASTQRLVECQRVAPTGSRLRTHVECGKRGGYNNFKVRTWADIEKERQ